MPEGTPTPNGLGSEVRERRRELGLSVRALAARAAISPAYVTAIETGRNATTGRPPVLSAAITARLAAALELDVHRLLAASGDMAAPDGAAEHVLLYAFDALAPGPLLTTIDDLLGAAVDHWLYLADPRGEAPAPTERTTVRQWGLGRAPYATPQLDPAAIVDALEREVRALAPAQAGRRVGLVIADCSAVMRYVQNADAEVGLERSWHGHVERIWRRHLGVPPAVDVCAYRHEDVAALGLTIDGLATALDLIDHHDRVLAVDGGQVVVGAPAIRRILQHARPPGSSSGSWARLADAASRTLATTS